MDAFVALAPSALGVDGAALVGLWVKDERERAAVRVQAAWRGWRPRFTPGRLSCIADAFHVDVAIGGGTVEQWDVNALYPWSLLGADVD